MHLTLSYLAPPAPRSSSSQAWLDVSKVPGGAKAPMDNKGVVLLIRTLAVSSVGIGCLVSRGKTRDCEFIHRGGVCAPPRSGRVLVINVILVLEQGDMNSMLDSTNRSVLSPPSQSHTLMMSLQGNYSGVLLKEGKSRTFIRFYQTPNGR